MILILGREQKSNVANTMVTLMCQLEDKTLGLITLQAINTAGKVITKQVFRVEKQ